MSDLKRARHVAFTAGKSAVLRAAVKAGVAEFGQIATYRMTKYEKFAARCAVRGLMVRLHVYDEFCEALEQEEEG